MENRDINWTESSIRHWQHPAETIQQNRLQSQS